LRCDLLRHRALDLEEIRQVAVVAVGPHLAVVLRVDELHLDAHAVASALHATLEYVGDAQLLADVSQVTRALFVLEYGRARDDLEIADPGKLVEQLAVDAVGEVRAVRARAQVREGEHCERPADGPAPVTAQ